MTIRHGRVLLEDKETPTLTETEGVCNKWVVRKELLDGTKKLKKLSMQRKLRLELG